MKHRANFIVIVMRTLYYQCNNY